MKPLIYFPYSDLYLTNPETETEKKTTESVSIFKNLTVIKDNSSSNCLTGNGPTLCLGEQTFLTQTQKLPIKSESGLRNLS